MSEADVVEYHWSETNGKKYRRGSRQFKKVDVGIEPTPAAETPKVPWKWEEDGMTVIRGYRTFGTWLPQRLRYLELY